MKQPPLADLPNQITKQYLPTEITGDPALKALTLKIVKLLQDDVIFKTANPIETFCLIAGTASAVALVGLDKDDFTLTMVRLCEVAKKIKDLNSPIIHPTSGHA